MEATYLAYEFLKSVDRITEIVDSADASYVDSATIPSRERLTFLNGFYVQASVVFIDIRGSKQLAIKHTRPVLAKIYRSYISETVAILRGNQKINEVYIEGDGIWAVFDTPYKSDVDSVFNTIAQVASLNDVLNIKLSKKGYSKFDIGIGADYGESLYIKAGHKNSGINDVVWVGKVVGGAAQLCSDANKLLTSRIMVSNVFFDNLKVENKSLLHKNYAHDCYTGDAVNVGMHAWVRANG